MDNAINHYIEAGKSFKAIEAGISAKQWKKAVMLLDSLDPIESGKPYFLQLASHFQEIRDYSLAEKYLVLAGKPQQARHQRWTRPPASRGRLLRPWHGRGGARAAHRAGSARLRPRHP